jgi:hypothetical protein
VTPALSRLFAWLHGNLYPSKETQKQREVQRSDVLFQEETQRKNSAKCISVNMRVVKACECVRLFFRPPKVSSAQAGFIFRVSASYGQHVCASSAYACTAHMHPPPSTLHKTLLATYGSALLILMKARNKTLEKHSLPRSFHLPAPMGVHKRERERERALFGWRGRLVEFQPFAQ